VAARPEAEKKRSKLLQSKWGRSDRIWKKKSAKTCANSVIKAHMGGDGRDERLRTLFLERKNHGPRNSSPPLRRGKRKKGGANSRRHRDDGKGGHKAEGGRALPRKNSGTGRPDA